VPYMTNGKRDYSISKKLTTTRTLRTELNVTQARRRAEREGKVSKGDGTHVDHIENHCRLVVATLLV
jgi:hypothetical protein